MNKYSVSVNEDGDKRWYEDDLTHRENGPAFIYFDENSHYAEERNHWYLRGYYFTTEEAHSREVARGCGG